MFVSTLWSDAEVFSEKITLRERELGPESFWEGHVNIYIAERAHCLHRVNRPARQPGQTPAWDLVAGPGLEEEPLCGAPRGFHRGAAVGQRVPRSERVRRPAVCALAKRRAGPWVAPGWPLGGLALGGAPDRAVCTLAFAVPRWRVALGPRRACPHLGEHLAALPACLPSPAACLLCGPHFSLLSFSGTGGPFLHFLFCGERHLPFPEFPLWVHSARCEELRTAGVSASGRRWREAGLRGPRSLLAARSCSVGVCGPRTRGRYQLRENVDAFVSPGG